MINISTTHAHKSKKDTKFKMDLCPKLEIYAHILLQKRNQITHAQSVSKICCLVTENYNTVSVSTNKYQILSAPFNRYVEPRMGKRRKTHAQSHIKKLER